MRDDRTLQVDMDERDELIIVSPRGEVDLSTSPELREALKSALRDRPKRIIVNMTDVPSVDSSAIATLIEAMRSSSQQRTKLVLCSVQERVRSVFEIARLDSVFDIRPDLDSAMGA
ncbi:MAG: STAS domain-containing protein [Phycisphaerales bacterium]